MKEILGRKIKGFVQSSVDPASVPFVDKAQEKQRQTKLQEKQAEDAAQAADENAKWAKAVEERKEARAKEKAKAKAERERTRTEKRAAKRNERADEWKMLQVEECLAKKLRKGRITAKQFDTRVKQASKRGEAGKRIAQDDSDDEDSDDEAKDGDKRSDARPYGCRKKRRGKARKKT